MAFNALINSIAPVPTPSDWVRASDWPVITDTPNEVQYLVADTGAKAFTIRTTFTRTTGNIYIDWGDGVTDTISTTTSTNTNHVYSTGGTPCSRGYNTFKIRIYGDPTCVITNAQQVSNFAVTGGNPYYTVGVLEAYFGDNTCNTSAFSSEYFNSSGNITLQPSFQLLEYVKLPATVTWTTQMASMFQFNYNLYKVIMPTSASGLTALNTTFNRCVNLRDIILPSNATGITTLNSAFSNCTNLRTISFPTTLNSCTVLTNALNSCISLKNVTFPSIDSVTTLQQTFTGCFSLQWVRFTSLPAPTIVGTLIDFSNTFLNCNNLQNVYYPSSCSTNSSYQLANTFQNCTALKNMIFPIDFRVGNLGSAFQGCISLTNVIFQSVAPFLTNASSAFSGCSLLNSVTLPSSSSSSGISLANAFQNCVSLPSITIPSGFIISALSSTFTGCINLTSITLPNNAQNFITTMASMCSGCSKLQTIIMPTSLNAVNNILSAFQNCSSLTSVVFPATMNSVTNASNLFNGCSNLTSVTLPTSMSGCTTFVSAFESCSVLPSLTMPATVATATNYTSLIRNCYSLKILTLPTTQTTGLSSITTMFSACGNLTTINNLDKVGSLTATPVVNGTMASGGFTGANIITSLSFSCPFSILTLNGSSTTNNFNLLNSLRLLNASAGQYTGLSPQINVSFCNLGVAALNQLFTDLPTVTSRTINITSCPGAAGCTRSIATAKGWIVTG